MKQNYITCWNNLIERSIDTVQDSDIDKFLYCLDQLSSIVHYKDSTLLFQAKYTINEEGLKLLFSTYGN